MRKFVKHNSLSIVFLLLFIISLWAQVITGFHTYNNERKDEGLSAVSLPSYLHSGHFIQATFENWESEFLQMALFVVLTISLKQKGSSESKKFDEQEEVNREPDPEKKDAPWPVHKGGL